MTTILRILGGVAAALCLAACSPSRAPQSSGPKAPLYDNLGNYHYAITTTSPEAQKYFDQGLTLSYAFNHAESIRAFRQATSLDPKCAMCYWGIAFAFGPNINAPITEEAAKEAWQAIEQARAVAAAAPEKERAFIEALAKRYTADPKADRPPLDRAYAEAMRDVSTRFADDLDAATLYAQSLMDTSPWNYWDQDGSPRQFTNDVLRALESKRRRIPAARRSTPTSSRPSCPAPAISCTCRRTSTCGPAATTTHRSRTRTRSKPTRRTSRATPLPAT